MTPAADVPSARVEAWLERHPRRVLVGLLGAATFVRFVLCLQVAAGPLPRVHELLVDSDGAFYDQWGSIVARGDWLQREPLHPMPAWLRFFADEVMDADPAFPVRVGLASDEGYDRTAMRRLLWDRWLGGATWFQEPIYAYLVGITYLLSGRSAWHVFAWQLVLGVLGVLLVHRVGLKLFSRTAALAGGVLAVLAPIPLFYEVTLLRESLIVSVTLALMLVMVWATEGGGRRWLVLGAAFGAASLLKQSFLAFPVLMGVWRLSTTRAPLKERAAVLGLVVSGFALALLPAVARNVAVGAPALRFVGSVSAMLPVFHTFHATPFDLTLTPEFTRVLLVGDGQPLPALLEAFRSHPSLWSVLWLELQKLVYAFHGFESASDVDFYLFRHGAPLLAFLPVTFVVLLPLTGVGFWARRAAAWPIAVVVLASLPVFILTAAVARYRAPITASLFPVAGAGAACVWGWVLRRNWRALVVAVAITVPYVAWATTRPFGKEADTQAAFYEDSGLYWLDFGEPAFAALQLEESLRLQPGSVRAEHKLGQALFAAGDAERALPHVERAARSTDSPELRELHACVLADLGRRDEAIALAKSALSADPARVAARKLLETLEPGAQLP